MSKPWHIATVRAGGALYWVAFYNGQRVGRATELARLLNAIGRIHRSGALAYPFFAARGLT